MLHHQVNKAGVRLHPDKRHQLEALILQTHKRLHPDKPPATHLMEEVMVTVPLVMMLQVRLTKKYEDQKGVYFFSAEAYFLL